MPLPNQGRVWEPFQRTKKIEISRFFLSRVLRDLDLLALSWTKTNQTRSKKRLGHFEHCFHVLDASTKPREGFGHPFQRTKKIEISRFFLSRVLRDMDLPALLWTKTNQTRSNKRPGHFEHCFPVLDAPTKPRERFGHPFQRTKKIEILRIFLSRVLRDLDFRALSWTKN